MDGIIDNEVQNLSGGELQRTAIVLALGKPADIYLIDEPSAYLDSEQVRPRRCPGRLWKALEGSGRLWKALQSRPDD
jgi:ABC-type molybdenum transport system ATPase subunit/photorepair protein PhrA